MRITAIYVRQSADRADSVSLETQESLCRADTAPDEPVTVFRDRGFSGKNTDRPALRAMMQQVSDGQIGRVLVYKLDRISRNLADFTELLRCFQTHGTAFQSCTERFETLSPMGQAMQSLLMVFAQLERETISSRVRDAAFSRARMGFDTGGRPPFGFRKVPALIHGRHSAMLEPDEHADTVQRMFRDYLAPGASLASVCAEQNAAQQKHIWTESTMRRLLRNPVYVRADAAVYAELAGRGAELCIPETLPAGHGICLYADRRCSRSRFTDLHGTLAVCAPHTGIVPAEIWLACQQKLTGRRRAGASGSGAKTWLSGMIFCKRCGSAMTAVQGRNAVYLVCAGKKRGQCSGAGAVWRAETAEALVGDALRHCLRRLSACRIPVPGETAPSPLDALILRRSQLMQQLTDPNGGDLALLTEAAAHLSEQIAALSAADTRGRTRRAVLPDYDRCDASARRLLAQTLLFGIFADGTALDIVLK